MDFPLFSDFRLVLILSPYSILAFDAFSIELGPFFSDCKHGLATFTPDTRRVLNWCTFEQYMRVTTASVYSSALL